MKIIIIQFLLFIKLINGFLVSPTVLNEKKILQECCKINKKYTIESNKEIYNLVNKIIKKNNIEKFYIDDMELNSKWRLIYSNIYSYNYKIYEYILNKNVKYKFVSKKNNSNMIIETRLLNLNLNNNFIHIKPYLLNNKCNYSSIMSDYKIIYISEKIKILELNDSKLLKIYYKIFN